MRKEIIFFKIHLFLKAESANKQLEEKLKK
jgi:hypothetical protein